MAITADEISRRRMTALMVLRILAVATPVLSFRAVYFDPASVVIALAALVAAVVLWFLAPALARRCVRAPEADTCPACGYKLEGLSAASRCPECGLSIDTPDRPPPLVAGERSLLSVATLALRILSLHLCFTYALSAWQVVWYVLTYAGASNLSLPQFVLPASAAALAALLFWYAPAVAGYLLPREHAGERRSLRPLARASSTLLGVVLALGAGRVLISDEFGIRVRVVAVLVLQIGVGLIIMAAPVSKMLTRAEPASEPDDGSATQ